MNSYCLNSVYKTLLTFQVFSPSYHGSEKHDMKICPSAQETCHIRGPGAACNPWLVQAAAAGALGFGWIRGSGLLLEAIMMPYTDPWF